MELLCKWPNQRRWITGNLLVTTFCNLRPRNLPTVSGHLDWPLPDFFAHLLVADVAASQPHCRHKTLFVECLGLIKSAVKFGFVMSKCLAGNLLG